MGHWTEDFDKLSRADKVKAYKRLSAHQKRAAQSGSVDLPDELIGKRAPGPIGTPGPESGRERQENRKGPEATETGKRGGVFYTTATGAKVYVRK